METNLNRNFQNPLKEKEQPAEKTERLSKHWDDHSLTRRPRRPRNRLTQPALPDDDLIQNRTPVTVFERFALVINETKQSYRSSTRFMVEESKWRAPS
ncbi:unnamed protein product [Brassica oleracea var. botrytis]